VRNLWKGFDYVNECVCVCVCVLREREREREREIMHGCIHVH